jgi:hypothetical protein
MIRLTTALLTLGVSIAACSGRSLDFVEPLTE